MAMIVASEPAKKVWTEQELQALPDNGYRHEVVDGELIMSPKNNFQHEHICTRLLVGLENFNRSRRLGVVLGSSAGFWMFNRNCRAPDISFIPKARLLSLGLSPSSRKFFPGAPDLAVEVLSPNNTRAEMDARLKDFFASGTQIAWLINPEEQCVEVCHSPTQRKLLGSGTDLDGEHLLPGFHYPIADLFKEWDWE
jgi:Uma2 family endonuclease